MQSVDTCLTFYIFLQHILFWVKHTLQMLIEVAEQRSQYNKSRNDFY